MEWLLVGMSIAGMALGGHYFVGGAASIGRRCGLPVVLVGTIVVGLGTSLAEWFFAVDAARLGLTEMVAGTVVGSNVCNLFVILGAAAVLSPVVVKGRWLWRDGGIMAGATLVFVLVAIDGVVDRREGFVLLGCLFAVGVLVVVTSSTQEVDEEPSQVFRWWIVPQTFVALGVILGSSHVFVEGAREVSETIGISQWLVGLTLTAGGTSLPEFVAVLSAVAQKRPALAIGTLLGSNTLNVLLVLGSAAAVHPLESHHLTMTKLLLFAGLMIVSLIVMAWRRRISRWVGAGMILIGLVWFLLEVSGYSTTP
ncbi:MAG: sodium:calcium antiporter [Gemmataceae bacterium]